MLLPIVDLLLLMGAGRANDNLYFFDDLDLVESSISRGEELLARITGDDDLATAQRRHAGLLARGLIVKVPEQVNWRVAAEAPVLAPAQILELQRLGEVIDAFLSIVSKKLASSAWLRQQIGFPAVPTDEPLLPHFADEPLSFFRLDLTPDTDGNLRLLEINVVVAGLGITQVLREVYGPHPDLPGIAAGLEPALLAAHRAESPGDRPPLIAAFTGKTDFMRHELWALSRSFSQAELAVCPWYKRCSQPPLGLPDRRAPDQVFRIFSGGPLEEPWSSTSCRQHPGGSLLRVLNQLVEDRSARIINPWLDALEDKRLLALMHHPEAPTELFGALSADDWVLLRRVLPPTDLVTPALSAQLTGRPRSARGFYLKQARSSRARGIVDGQQINRGAWDRAVDQAVNDGDWVVQRAVRGEPWPFRFLDTDSQCLRSMNGFVRASPYYFRNPQGRMELADVCITARPQRSRVHGATDACIVVPRPVAAGAWTGSGPSGMQEPPSPGEAPAQR